MYRRKILRTAFFLLIISFFITSPSSVHANVFDSIVNGVKSLFNKDIKSTNLTIETNIELASGGDSSKNGQIDAGDILKFSYTITNPTQNTYSFATLKTNLNSKQINSIRNLRGAFSLEEKDSTLVIPNISIKPNQMSRISFEAQVNFNKNTDTVISTEPELMGNNNESIYKAQKKEVNAKKMDQEIFNKVVNITP